MKNNFGTNISMTIFGESHGPCIGITLDGLPAGFKINLERINAGSAESRRRDKRRHGKAKGKRKHIHTTP